MSTMKATDYVASEFYGTHLRGDSAKFANNQTTNRTALHQRMYMRNLTELACNRFSWENMPEGIDKRFLELNMFYRALTVFFKDPVNGGFFVLKGTPHGQWDIADNPTKFQVIGNQYAGRVLEANRTYVQAGQGLEATSKDPECVPIWANYLRVPDLDIVMLYAYKFAELDVTIEINSKNARRNKIVAVDENQQLSATNINRQIDAGENFIPLTPNGVQALPVALDLGINPDSIEKLHILKVRLWNECMGLLGINGANQDKKERLVSDEVAANDEQVAANRAIALNAREDAVEQINKLWGLNIKVRFRSDAELAKMQEKAGAPKADESNSKPTEKEEE